MALALGAEGVWVGTRFVCAQEAGASEGHQREILSAGYESTVRTLAYSGRPLRVKVCARCGFSWYLLIADTSQKLTVASEWEGPRRGEMEVVRVVLACCSVPGLRCVSQALLARGIIPYAQQEAHLREAGRDAERQRLLFERHLLMGQCAGAINSIEPAAAIVESMVAQAVAVIQLMGSKL